MRKVKLLILIHSLEVGGAEGQVYELARGLAKDAYDVTVCSLTAKGSYIEMLRAEGVRVEVLSDRLRQMAWRWIRLVRLMQREQFDVVQNFMFTAAVVGTPIARALGVPVVINCIRSLGFLHFRYRIPVKRVLYKFSNRVIANSQQIASSLVANMVAEGNRITVVYNGVDTEKFRPPKTPEETERLKHALGIAENSPVIGMVANLSPVKNHDCMLKAVPMILSHCPQARFLLIGDGSLRNSLEKTARALGISQAVFFWAKEGIRQSCIA